MIDPWEHCIECGMCGELYCTKCDAHFGDCECPGLLELCGEDIDED